VTLVCEIFEKADPSVSTPFIHALAPRILEFLYSEEARNVQTKAELEMTLESIRAIQILVQVVDASEKRKFHISVSPLFQEICSASTLLILTFHHCYYCFRIIGSR